MKTSSELLKAINALTIERNKLKSICYEHNIVFDYKTFDDKIKQLVLERMELIKLH